MKLGYWPAKGRAELIQYTAAYLGVSLEAVTETGETWNDAHIQELGLPFSNLPYLIDGEFKFSESLMIVAYIAKKAGKPEFLG